MFDTVKGSDYLADQDFVEIFAKEAPSAIITLEQLGVPFSRNENGKIEQRRFGGHTRNFGEAPIKRACYASDRTGRAIMDAVYDACLANNVTLFNEVFINKLLFTNNTCCGVAGFNIEDCEPQVFQGKAVVIATGGCGRIYKVTSNGYASTGDGLALALTAGIPLEDMEFVQFHPTGIHGLGILISEAARAEGGILTNVKGERFMEGYASTLKDLAPRDIISRAVLTEIREGRGIDGKDFVYLDLQGLGKERLEQKLPEISSLVRTYLGIDPSGAPIPVAPTCHYIMGGIPTDANGHVTIDSQGTGVRGLYAVGECACVSVHGANRLGCNSLIDLVVFGKRVGIEASRFASENEFAPLPDRAENEVQKLVDGLLASAGNQRVPRIRGDLQQTMTEKCSVFREETGLNEALEKIRNLKQECADLGIANRSRRFNYELTEALELRNMLNLAEVIVFSAFHRLESRGSHFRNDFPERNDEAWLKHTFATSTNQGLQVSYKPVAITRFQPEKRRY
jgi:succinate dehydrogenase / fumarate reductase flavoprotein subunit